MWLSKDVTSSGMDVVCWGDAVGAIMWSVDLFCGIEVLDGGVVSVRYDVCVSSGMSAWFMHVCEAGWTWVDDCVGSLDNLRCGVFAGRWSVVLRVSMLVRS